MEDILGIVNTLTVKEKLQLACKLIEAVEIEDERDDQLYDIVSDKLLEAIYDIAE